MSHMKTKNRAPRFVRTPHSSHDESLKVNLGKPSGASKTRAVAKAKDSYGAKNSAGRVNIPRSNLNDASDAGASHGAYDRAVSAALLGVTGVGALMSCTPAMASPVTGHLVHHDTNPHEASAIVNDSLGIENTEMPTISLEDIDPIEAKANRVMERFGERFENSSRLTPYELANPHTVELLDGHPGYKRLSDSQIKSMVLETLKEMPLGSLPAGDALVDLVESLPGLEGIDASSKSFNELQDIVKSNARDWLDDKFGDYIEEHKIEVAVVGAGAVSGLRAASPEAREFINKHAPAIRVWNASSDNGLVKANAKLKYRGDDILPNLDLAASARKNIGPVALRAGINSRFSIDNLDHLDSRVHVGARVGDSEKWADVSAWAKDDSRYGARFELGTKTEINGYHLNGNTRLDLGPGSAVDPNADGRFSVNVTAAKTFRDSNNDVRGSFGLYGSHGMDTNGGAKDTSVGVMFRWTW